MFEPGALLANVDTKENLEMLLKNKFLDKKKSEKEENELMVKINKNS